MGLKPIAEWDAWQKQNNWGRSWSWFSGLNVFEDDYYADFDDDEEGLSFNTYFALKPFEPWEAWKKRVKYKHAAQRIKELQAKRNALAWEIDDLESDLDDLRDELEELDEELEALQAR